LAAADAAAAADAVFDDERLAQVLGELLRHQPRDGIGAAAGGERNDEPDRALGPARGGRLRMSDLCPQQARQQCQGYAPDSSGPTTYVRYGPARGLLGSREFNHAIRSASRRLSIRELRSRKARASLGSSAVRRNSSWLRLRTAGSFSASSRLLRMVC